MRRLISIAALALLLAVPVWAQRGGGGHAGGGMHAGGFAGHSGGGHVGGGRSFSGVHSNGMRPSPGPSRGFNHSSNRTFSHGTFHDHNFHGHPHHGFANNCIGCWGWGSWYPWWGGYYGMWSTWDDQDRRFDEDYYRQYEIANEWNRQNLEQQRMMREQDADGDQDAYAPRSSERRPAYDSASQPQDPAPATVLVFRDQHREEVSNYAIVGQTLSSFSGQRTKKIPLANLDIVATQKANDDRGVTFRAPGATEGQ